MYDTNCVVGSTRHTQHDPVSACAVLPGLAGKADQGACRHAPAPALTLGARLYRGGTLRAPPTAGHQIGSILSLLWSPLLIASVGVDAMFYLYGLAGLAWMLAWQPLVAPHAPLLHDHRAPGGTQAAPLKMSELPWRAVSKGGGGAG